MNKKRIYGKNKPRIATDDLGKKKNLLQISR